jgi:short-subunit dehydrogenase
MRAQHSGKIINVSSMGGWYHTTKYAVEAFSDALRMEAKQFGIDVILIEPGGIKTDWGNIAADHPAALRVTLMKRLHSRSLRGCTSNTMVIW